MNFQAQSARPVIFDPCRPGLEKFSDQASPDPNAPNFKHWYRASSNFIIITICKTNKSSLTGRTVLSVTFWHNHSVSLLVVGIFSTFYVLFWDGNRGEGVFSRSPKMSRYISKTESERDQARVGKEYLIIYVVQWELKYKKLRAYRDGWRRR